MRSRLSKKSQLKDTRGSGRVRTYIMIGAVVLGVIALGSLLYLSVQEPKALEDIQRFVGLSRGHDETIDYSGLDLPPVGGLHSGIWQNCGIYDQPLDSKNAVHSMEHGAVWIAYRSELDGEDITALQNMVRDEPYVLLSPYPNLRSPVVLSAWGVQLEVDSANDSRIANFIEQYQQGPQTPELGATCSDGVGTPLN